MLNTRIFYILLCFLLSFYLHSQSNLENDKCGFCHGTKQCTAIADLPGSGCGGSGTERCFCDFGRLKCYNCKKGKGDKDLPGTSCKVCYGKGYYDCDECKATGYVKCKKCNGSGKCTYCLGTGSYTKGRIQSSQNDQAGIISWILSPGPENDLNYKKVYGGLSLGTGFYSLPLISNRNDANGRVRPSSEIENNIPMFFEFGGKIGFFARRGISLYLSPFFSYGYDYLGGRSGSYLNYGSSATLYTTRKYNSWVSPYFEFAYVKRSGSFRYDIDEFLASQNIDSKTSVIYYGNFNYSLMRFGGGMRVRLSQERDSWIKPGIYFEKISFIDPNDDKVMIGNIECLIGSGIGLSLSYSKNYAIAGYMEFQDNFTPKNKDYWEIKLYKIFVIK